jgi:pyrimidine 5'-nucleotidase
MADRSTLFIDLDDTLYPRDNGVWHAISRRIQDFLIQRIGLDPDEADQLRASYLSQFGTTLNGLRAHYDIDPFEYLAFVHDVPLETMIQPDTILRQVLTGISMRKIIFTNASPQHAQRVLTLLGVADQIELIIDIVTLDFVNKPDPAAYQKALKLSGDPSPQDCVMVDDRPSNLHPAGALGFTTILVGSAADGQGIDFCLPSIYDLPQVLPHAEREQS